MFRNWKAKAASLTLVSNTPMAWLQTSLALGSALSGWMAIRDGLMTKTVGQALCLGAPQNSLLAATGHCPWCYAALALMALAAWPMTVKA
jgi:hypothetical protein